MENRLINLLTHSSIRIHNVCAAFAGANVANELELPFANGFSFGCLFLMISNHNKRKYKRQTENKSQGFCSILQLTAHQIWKINHQNWHSIRAHTKILEIMKCAREANTIHTIQSWELLKDSATHHYNRLAQRNYWHKQTRKHQNWLLERSKPHTVFVYFRISFTMWKKSGHRSLALGMILGMIW